MPFKKKEVVVNPKEVEKNNVLEIRAMLDELTNNAYLTLSQKYGYTEEFIKKVHKRVIYKYIV